MDKSLDKNSVLMQKYISYLNTINKTDKVLDSDLNAEYLMRLAPRMWYSRGKLYFWMQHIQSLKGNFIPNFKVAFGKIPLINHLMYGLLYLIIKEKNMKALKLYFSCVIFFFQGGLIPNKQLSALIVRAIQLDFKFEYHYEIINIILKEITKKSLGIIPSECFKKLIKCFINETGFEFHLNKHFLLLLSIDDPEINTLALDFLIKAFKFNYDISLATYLTKRAIKANFAFKFNSIVFIKKLIKEEELIRQDDSFYIKKGFVFSENNSLEISKFGFESKGFTIIFSFRYDSPTSDNNDEDNKVVLFTLNSHSSKGIQKVYSLEIKNDKIIIYRSNAVEGEYSIKRNKDYLVVITQRLIFNYNVFKKYELDTVINNNSFISRNLDNELKLISFSFGKNFKGILGSFHLSKTQFEKPMINHLFNLKEDYCYVFKFTYDLSLLKAMSNRLIMNDSKYREAFGYFLNSSIQMEINILPCFIQRFMAHANLLKLNNNIIFQHADNKTDLRIQVFRKFSLFQFIKFEGFNYITLLFGLLSDESNDNINNFIATILSFLLDLIDYLESKYFKREYYLIFTIIVNFISSNSMNGKFKVNQTLYFSLQEKMNCFIINEELALRNCFASLLLDKSIYETPLANNSLISLFASVASCIKSNSIGLMEKEILRQLLTYSNLIESTDIARKPYLRLLAEFNISCVRNDRFKALEPLIEYVTNNQDLKPIKKYKILKMIYIYIGKNDLVKSNDELCDYINNQFESADFQDQCRWTNLSLCMSYLILKNNVDIINEFKAKFDQPIDKLCLGYPFILAPTIEFFKCVFVELFIEAKPKTKKKFIKGKTTFKHLTFPKDTNIKSVEWLKTKFFSLEKYLETIIEKATQEYYKTTGEQVLNFIHDFIKQLLDFIKEEKFMETNKAIFTSQTLSNYIFFLNRKNLGQPEKLLIDIIENTLPSITRPFYFNFLYDFYESNIMIENDMSLIIEKITHILCNQQTCTKNFRFNQFHYLLILYQIIASAQNRISNLLDRCVLTFFNYLSNQEMIMTKDQIKNDKETKTCLELVFDTMILLCKNYKADENHTSLLTKILKNGNNSIFYRIDYNTKQSSDPIGPPAEYSFTLYFLVKIMIILYKERGNQKIFSFLNEIAILTFNDMHFILSKSKTKKIMKNNTLKDADAKEILDFFDRKNMIKNYSMFEETFFNYCNEKGFVKTTNSEKNIISLTKSSQHEISNLSENNLSRRDSNPFPKWRRNYDLAALDVDVDSTSETLVLKKRSYSQAISTKRNNNTLINLFMKKKSQFNVNMSKSNEEHLYLIEDREMESVKTLFSIKHNILKHTFPFIFKEYLFHNKNFIRMRNIFNSNFPIKPENNVLKELDYPTKLRNYICKSYYKPFLKPDLHFFSNPLYHISHPYYSTPEDDPLTFLQFNPIFPKMKNILFKAYCELVTNLGSIFGEIIFNSNYLIFIAKPECDVRGNPKISAKEKLHYCFSTDENDMITKSKKKILFYLDEIEEVLARRCFFQWIGLEFFLANRKSYFFNLFHEKKKQQFISILSTLGINTISIITDWIPAFKKQGYMKQWQNNKLSTFEYILMINKYSGRSFNDPYQYPIFPWVYSDAYTTPRDFSRVICDQSETKREALYIQYKRNNNHFNFHYSNSGHVLYYLSRTNPFTYNLIKFQSYKFDVPSRMFTSISDTLTIFTMLNETRELIPEFFYDYNFMINLNKNDFGFVKEKNLRLNDVICDLWKTYSYISHLRLRLEQGDNVCLWIDNIFGVNQLKNVNKVMNMFSKTTYEKNNNLQKKITKWINNHLSSEEILDRIRSKISMYAFGICPYQLIQKVHPRKNIIPEVAPVDYLHENLGKHLKSITGDKFRVWNNKNMIFVKFLFSLEIFTLTKEKKETPKKTISFSKQGHLRFRKESCCQISPTVFAFCRFFDNTIRFYDIDDKARSLVIQCDDFITSICAIGNKQFVTGDENGFISKWLSKRDQDYLYQINKRVIGHECEVLKIHFEERLDIILSIDERNICVIHNIYTMDLIIIIQIKEKIHDVKISFQDFIFFLCDCGNLQRKFYIYSLNGLLLAQTDQAREIAEFELSVNSSEIIIAQGENVYKSDIFAIDLLKKRHSTDQDLIFSFDEDNIIKEMIFCRELDIILFVFKNNSLAIKHMTEL